VLVAATCLSLGMSAAPTDNAPELSEKISGGIAGLSTLFEAKNWDEALKVIDGLLAKADPISFDRAFLADLKANVLGSKGDLGAAIEPLETALKIGDELKLFRFARALPIGEQETLINLASLYIADASAPGKTIDYQRAAYAKAHLYGKRLVDVKKPTVEAQSMWARILYSEAILDASKVDLTLMKQAAAEAEKALYLVIKPKEENYTLLLAALQQLGDNVRCAELLELLVQKFPNSKSYWPMLFNTYVALQGSGDKTVDLSAVVALERAQAAGQMTSNKDNFMLAGLYYNIQQYAFASELLEKGLRNGKIDPEQKNWELLAACYQQMNKDARAAEVFLEAIKLFPKSPNLELQVGQIYYNTEKHNEAYKHLQAAVAKGLEKPSQTLVLIAYLALENKRLDDALSASEKAVKADPKSKEAIAILKVVKESIAERDTFLNNKK
jgi:Tfp pilus assembly protein PilF